MTTDLETDEKFGCNRCWPDNTSAAWRARTAFKSMAEVIDESHFHVIIQQCGSCTQRFVSIFTEMIDWTGGDDSQYWTIMPITEPEADWISQQMVGEMELEAVGPKRRCLQRDFPTGQRPEIYWSTGITIGPHD